MIFGTIIVKIAEYEVYQRAFHMIQFKLQFICFVVLLLLSFAIINDVLRNKSMQQWFNLNTRNYKLLHDRTASSECAPRELCEITGYNRRAPLNST